MRSMEWIAGIGIAVAAALASAVAEAEVATYTRRADFDAAIADLQEVEVLDFDDVPDETLIPSGSSLDGVTFTYAIADDLGSYDLLVIDSFETTSGLQSLGLTFGDVLLSGDAFTMSFDRTIHAVGLFVLAGLLNEGEMELRIGGTASVANAAEPDRTFSGGGGAWFLGLVETDPAAPGFDAVDVESSAPPGEDFEWNVDDVVSAVSVSESGSASALVALAALAATAVAPRQRRRA